jgi:hypothetical protein
MPDMAQVRAAVDDLKARFASDPAVMEKLQPLLDKLQSLFS